MQGVERIVQSGGQRTVKVSLVHEQREEIAELVSQTSQQLHRISVITEQWSGEEKWTLLLTRLLRAGSAANGSPACLMRQNCCYRDDRIKNPTPPSDAKPHQQRRLQSSIFIPSRFSPSRF